MTIGHAPTAAEFTSDLQVEMVNVGAVWLLGFLAVTLAALGLLSLFFPQRQVDLRIRMGRPSFSATGVRIVGAFEIALAVVIGVVLVVTVTRVS